VIDWVDRLCQVPLTFRAGNLSLREVFVDAGPPLCDRGLFLSAVVSWLREHPDLVDIWRGYSEDKRTGRGPYFGNGKAALEVGFLETEVDYVGPFEAVAKKVEWLDVRLHTDPVEACADFIYREAVLVLTRQRAS
jgi:hypothetical protein